MANKTKPNDAGAAAPVEPTHGGVYEQVGDALRVIEGGPPVAAPVPPPAPQPKGEGA